MREKPLGSSPWAWASPGMPRTRRDKYPVVLRSTCDASGPLSWGLIWIWPCNKEYSRKALAARSHKTQSGQGTQDSGAKPILWYWGPGSSWTLPLLSPTLPLLSPEYIHNFEVLCTMALKLQRPLLQAAFRTVASQSLQDACPDVTAETEASTAGLSFLSS